MAVTPHAAIPESACTDRVGMQPPDLPSDAASAPANLTLLAQVVSLTVIPSDPTAPNQTALLDRSEQKMGSHLLNMGDGFGPNRALDTKEAVIDNRQPWWWSIPTCVAGSRRP